MGGKIIAQSSMAKGPDGTVGFSVGWTSRKSAIVNGEFACVSSIDRAPNDTIFDRNYF